MKKPFQCLLIKYPTKILVSCLFFSLFAGKCLAVSTFTWNGNGTNSNWENAANWTKTTANRKTPSISTYPGESENDDIVVIGTTAYTNNNQPVLAVKSVKVASIEFGDNGGRAMMLTVNSGFILEVVTGDITQDHNPNTGGISTTITGLGTIQCDNDFQVGDTTTPPKPANGAADNTYATVINSSISNLIVSSGSLILNTESRDSNNGRSTNFNNPAFNLLSGNLTIQDIQTSDGNAETGDICTFKMNLGTNANTLTLLGTTLFSNLNSTSNVIDFVSGGTVSLSTVIFGATTGTQNIYTNTDGTHYGISITPTMYPNLTFSGGNKTIRSGTLSIGGDWNTGGGTINLTTNNPAISLTGNWINTTPINVGNGAISVTGNLNNSSTITGVTSTGTNTIAIGTMTNTGTITVNRETMTFNGAATNSGTYTGGTTTTATSTFNGSFTNNTAGTFTAGTANVNFNGDYTNSGAFSGSTTASTIFGGAGNQALADNSTNGTSLVSVTIQGSGTKSMSFGTSPVGTKGFIVPSNGALTMAGTATLDGGGALTLNSDATGSAIVNALPSTTHITGNVNVQRFIQGSTDLTKRGYALLTSTVYTGTDATSGNVFDLQYLTNYVYVSGYGRAANGFNVPTTDNPSLYLFREDNPPPPSINTVFTTGYNWKGVAKINNSPAYNIGTQAAKTAYNTVDTTTTIPVGNGILFYFRGAGNTNPLNYTSPFTPPADATLTQTGTLNTGNIKVRLWYSNAANNLGNNFSYTTGSIVTGPVRLSAGFTLVGNPYPATINWEKYNNSHTPGALTGNLGSTVIYEFNATTKNYDTYTPTANNTNTTSERPNSNYTGSATNFIASGMGFFVRTTGSNQNLTFTENAKVTTNGVASRINGLMGKPVATTTQPIPMIRLKLVTDSINNDDIVISLNNNASTKFVESEDAEDLGGSGSLESLSSFTSDSVAVAINSEPLPGKQPLVIRLLADAPASGPYQLTVPELSPLPALYVMWLKDAFTGDSVQLKLNTSYPFTIDKSNAATFGSSRFTVVISQDPALAYQLLSFTAAKVPDARQVQMVWKTANEQNYTNFTVQRSTDNGKTFDVLGGMQGTGAGQYSLLDKDPEKGDNLYRLKQEDINNVITYSKVVDVTISNKNNDDKFHIYPNPATHTINLDLSAKIPGNVSYDIIVTNSLGFIVKQSTSSQGNWQANVSDLRPGTYLVSILDKREKNLLGQAKFVKL